VSVKHYNIEICSGLESVFCTVGTVNLNTILMNLGYKFYSKPPTSDTLHLNCSPVLAMVLYIITFPFSVSPLY
jgi:hypothetical protein